MEKYAIKFQKDITQSVDLAESVLMVIEAESNQEARRKFNRNISITRWRS